MPKVKKGFPNPPTQPSPIELTDAKIETVKFYDQEIDVIFHKNQPYIIIKQINNNIWIHYTTNRDSIQKRIRYKSYC